MVRQCPRTPEPEPRGGGKDISFRDPRGSSSKDKGSSPRISIAPSPGGGRSLLEGRGVAAMAPTTAVMGGQPGSAPGAQDQEPAGGHVVEGLGVPCPAIGQDSQNQEAPRPPIGQGSPQGRSTLSETGRRPPRRYPIPSPDPGTPPSSPSVPSGGLTPAETPPPPPPREPYVIPPQARYGGPPQPGPNSATLSELMGERGRLLQEQVRRARKEAAAQQKP